MIVNKSSTFRVIGMPKRYRSPQVLRFRSLNRQSLTLFIRNHLVQYLADRYCLRESDKDGLSPKKSAVFTKCSSDLGETVGLPMTTVARSRRGKWDGWGKARKTRVSYKIIACSTQNWRTSTSTNRGRAVVKVSIGECPVSKGTCRSIANIAVTCRFFR